MDINDRNSLKKQLLVYTVGLLSSLKNNSITAEESFSMLFKPIIVKWLIKNDFDNTLINIIERASELEDIQNLIPDEYMKSVEKLYIESIEELKNMPTINPGSLFWNKFIVDALSETK